MTRDGEGKTADASGVHMVPSDASATPNRTMVSGDALDQDRAGEEHVPATRDHLTVEASTPDGDSGDEGSDVFRTPVNEVEDQLPQDSVEEDQGTSDPRAARVPTSPKKANSSDGPSDEPGHDKPDNDHIEGAKTGADGETKAVDIPTTENPPALAHPDNTSLTGSPEARKGPVSEWSHMQLAPKQEAEEELEGEGEWQAMPAFATHTIYDDWGKVLAREEAELDDDPAGYNALGGAGKGYTRVILDEDAQSATSMDDDTAYLFKQGTTTALLDDDEEGRDMLGQMQATKELLTEGQRIAYVGVVRIAMMNMAKELERLPRTKNTRKVLDVTQEAFQKWGQKMMVRLYGHMEISSAEQVMIEQLAEHGVEAGDLTPTLMQNARVKNPVQDEPATEATGGDADKSANDGETDVPQPIPAIESQPATPLESSAQLEPYNEEMLPQDMTVKNPEAIADEKKLDIDLRWTVICDLFLVVVADSNYDARSRVLLERVGKALAVEWIDVCRFEKRITDALEMQETAAKEKWNEEEHMQQREKAARNRKLIMMGLATVGGGLVIGLSAGLLAPVIGAGFAAGFTTIGVAGTSTFFGGAGAAALITGTGVVTGGTIGVRASSRRMGAVKIFEYRPLHNNKRVNLIVTVAGWMTGKVDDVRLPFSTVDPIMGDIYSVLWEPDMLQSMGQTINLLATEALTQGLQQILGSTILFALMAALQLPIVLTKLAYLIDNPWNVSLARADQAGLILADSLMERNLGIRPITLCGFSIGSRVIWSCLKELAKKGAVGLIQNVYLYGSPMVVNKDDYVRARSVVAGRFLNGYASSDWILGYLFRATSGGIMRVAGLAPVEVDGIENVNVTQWVPGHMSYRSAMPRLLREAGWNVESLEFSEIEDPDPDNHEKRQRELINEIEEARKQLERTPSKKGLRALFSKNKKLAEKHEWETYDERAKTAPESQDANKTATDDGAPVLFDVDAILREVAELSAQGIEIKEIESTLPPMQLRSASPAGFEAREIQGTLPPIRLNVDVPPPPYEPSAPRSGGNSRTVSAKTSSTSLRGAARNGSANGSAEVHPSPVEKEKKSSSWWRKRAGGSNDTSQNGRSKTPPMASRAESRPELARSAQTADATAATWPTVDKGAEGISYRPREEPAPVDLDRNAWADEDEFGHRGGEGEMTFE